MTAGTATTANYGVYSTTASTGAGFGHYTSVTGASNSGYGLYALNDSANGYAIYGTSASGYAGYFNGTTKVVGNFTVTGTCTGCGAGGSSALSGITAATTTSSIDSNNNAITWKWGTAKPA